MTTHPENYEDVTVYDLDANAEEELLLAHNECTFMWANKEGWPVGVIMSYIWRKGRFWLTASSQRARIHAVRRDPRVSILRFVHFKKGLLEPPRRAQQLTF